MGHCKDLVFIPGEIEEPLEWFTAVVRDESESEVAQLCPTLCDSMDCNPPGSSVHGIFQAGILEWVAIHLVV